MCTRMWTSSMKSPQAVYISPCATRCCFLAHCGCLPGAGTAEACFGKDPVLSLWSSWRPQLSLPHLLQRFLILHEALALCSFLLVRPGKGLCCRRAQTGKPAQPVISGLGYWDSEMRPPQEAADGAELLPSGTCMGNGRLPAPWGTCAAVSEGLIPSELFKFEEKNILNWCIYISVLK